ncbi:MAG: hypothetical protein MZV63_34770 [Marinilabiliales bacterium]|nr:hypothetical protein [Marinilabiliales bacterium]
MQLCSGISDAVKRVLLVRMKRRRLPSLSWRRPILILETEEGAGPFSEQRTGHHRGDAARICRFIICCSGSSGTPAVVLTSGNLSLMNP